MVQCRGQMKDRQFDMKNDGQTESPRKKLERNKKCKVCQWHILLGTNPQHSLLRFMKGRQPINIHRNERNMQEASPW